jgi:hypothetical protein
MATTVINIQRLVSDRPFPHRKVGYFLLFDQVETMA